MVRLRRSDPSSRGFRRIRSGRGFSYRDDSGETVRDGDLRARFEALAIPPAWSKVWIAPFPNGHIQATGIDAADRRQYIYHPVWRERHDRVKFDRALALAESLPAARAVVTRTLRDSYGLSTLLCNHVSVHKDTVILAFPAKSGKAWESDITDPDLARFVRGRVRRGKDKLLLSWSARGVEHAVTAANINAYVRERTNGDFTAKDFRSLHGTIAAAQSLASNEPAKSQRGRARAVKQAMEAAATILGNTPAIARKSYVDPRVLDLYAAGETIDATGQGSAESQLRALLMRDS